MRLWVPMPSCAPPPAAARPCSRRIRSAVASRSAVAQMTWSIRTRAVCREYAGRARRPLRQMSDFLALDTLVLDPRFNGPPGTANGGYACGAVGELVDGPAEVSLRTPPPLGVPLDVAFLGGGAVEVRHGDVLVAAARPVDGVDAEPPVRPSLADAREASRQHPGHGRDGLLSGCYVCGSLRHDGLGIHFGPLRDRDDVTAAVFLPDATVSNRDGVVAPEMVWAALDCPSYTPRLWDWDRPSLLARLAVERLDCVDVGEPIVATGWHLASEGRKHHTASALLGADGRLLARARALWITLT